jgi:hypothetical protein
MQLHSIHSCRLHLHAQRDHDLLGGATTMPAGLVLCTRGGQFEP